MQSQDLFPINWNDPEPRDVFIYNSRPQQATIMKESYLQFSNTS